LQKPASHIALVLFARSAPEEAGHKKLLDHLPAGRHQAIFEAFTQSSLALLAATGLPYYLISSAGQKGHTFGERLHQALAQTFALGYERVIVIGNDCPQLAVPDLHRAAGLLSRYDTVLGPCQQGGIYLLGLNKAAFEQAGNFEQIAWQTPAVHRQLTALLLQGQTTLACLATYADINTPQDFRRARQQKWFRSSLRSWIARLLDFSVPKLRHPQFLLNPIQYQPAACFRGPPVFIF
jgi:glycosyltransferase A (GT-A) superfamily protein (DUF2064 family)